MTHGTAAAAPCTCCAARGPHPPTWSDPSPSKLVSPGWSRSEPKATPPSRIRDPVMRVTCASAGARPWSDPSSQITTWPLCKGGAAHGELSLWVPTCMRSTWSAPLQHPLPHAHARVSQLQGCRATQARKDMRSCERVWWPFGQKRLQQQVAALTN